MPAEQSHMEQAFLSPAFDGQAIPVVFAANNGFIPIFAACFQSLLDHVSEKYNYDVFLIQTDVSRENQEVLSAMAAPYPNVSLRFFNASPLIRDYDLKGSAHISVETYFRFLIQKILPEYDKVLYLDCDLIVNADVAELYETDVEGFLLAAARDPEFLGHVNGADKQIQNYIFNELKMKDPRNYFQAGVLLFNEAEMRKAYTLEQWLTFASVPYRYNDQDVLNLYCEGRVKYLDMAWNLITDCDHTRVCNTIVHAPAEIQAAYHAAHAAPKIIHYAGHRKPWQKPTEDYGRAFWLCARKTPYYEEALHIMTRFTAAERFEELRRERSAYWKLRRFVKKQMSRLPENSGLRRLLNRLR